MLTSLRITLQNMTPKKRRTLRYWLMFLVFGISLFITIIVCGSVYVKQEMYTKFNPTFWVLGPDSQYNVTDLKASINVLSLGLGFSSFDPIKGLALEMALDPRNNLTTAGSTPTLPICVSYGEKQLTFEPFQEMTTTSFSLAFNGDSITFPLDVYTAELYINAHVGNATSNSTCVDPLPLSPAIVGSAQGYIITAKVTPGWDDDVGQKDYSTALISFTARRTKVTIGFSFLIMLVMWLLTGIVLTIAFWVWKSGRRTELGFVGISTALMYALPKLRDAQPGIPKLGTLADMLGYVWNVLIVACCVVAQLLNYLIRKNEKRW